jgi:hypothetical protein
VIVWLWQASSPGMFRGVTGDDRAARRAAAECITSGQAETATVEAASLMIGVSSLTDCNHRTGTGWTARRSGAGVRKRYPGGSVEVIRLFGRMQVEANDGRGWVFMRTADDSPLLALLAATETQPGDLPGRAVPTQCHGL